jgi:hypothetical protein
MKLPSRHLAFDLSSWPFGCVSGEDGVVQMPRLHGYPPFGYQPLSLFDRGNGDACGFYWPIGREEREPLLCDSSHDEYYLEPSALSLEGLVRLFVLRGVSAVVDFEELALIADTLGVELPQAPPQPVALHEIPLTEARDSPAVWCAHAEEALKHGDLEGAERCAVQALDLFPGFTAARFVLVKTLRRGRRTQEAGREMLQTFRSSACFGAGRHECMRWLQQMPDEAVVAPEDPLWEHRRSLTLATGVKRNDDFLLYEELIAEYLVRGMGECAVALRQAVDEMYQGETVSFRERYGYSDDEFFRRSAAEMEAAGLHQRAEAIRSSVEYY